MRAKLIRGIALTWLFTRELLRLPVGTGNYVVRTNPRDIVDDSFKDIRDDSQILTCADSMTARVEQEARLAILGAQWF